MRLTLSAIVLGALVLLTPANAVGAATPRQKALYRDGPSGRYLLDGAWFKRADPGDQGQKLAWQRESGLSGWQKTTIPSAANAGDFSTTSYTGSVHWFRKDFKAPSRSQAYQWALRFESVNYRAKVWLNGRPLGFHVGAYLPFEMRAKDIKRGGVNRLVVRVDSRRKKYDIPPLAIRKSGAFEGGWWNYNGILREVYLRRIDTFDFQQVVVQPQLRCARCAARVDVSVTVANVNKRGRQASISGSFGSRGLRFHAKRVPGRGDSTFHARLRIAKPQLWWIERPYLYTARLQLRDGGRVVQNYTVHTGIRSLRVSGLGRVQLNGRDLNVRGASIHEDSPSRGAALTRFQMKRNMSYLRELGAHMTRAHYPLHPYELELADRYGILVWSEIPVFRMASRFFGVAEVRNKALRMLRQEHARDANHPSIAVWSIGNENAARPGKGLRTYIHHAIRTMHALDPTRLVGIATSGFPSVEQQRIYLELDVVGVNDYFGWYNGPRGTISDRNSLAAYLDKLHVDYPHQGIFVTEFGAEANRHGPVTEKGTYEFQSDFLKYHLDVFAQKPWVSGALVWNLRDFRVKPGWAGGNPLPHPPVNEKGLIDDTGFHKPAFSVVQQALKVTGPYR